MDSSRSPWTTYPLGNDRSRNRAPGEGNVLSGFPSDKAIICLFPIVAGIKPSLTAKRRPTA